MATRAGRYLMLGLSLALVPGWCADWNPRLAARFLDQRQKEWFAWPAANKGATPCVSCHTGITYLMARPALRKELGEAEPTIYETGLLESLRSRISQREPAAAPGIGVESVLAALFVANNSVPNNSAFERMWALQIKDGEFKGSWNWFSLKDDPWEMPESKFFGASMAALAVGSAPEAYRARPEVRPQMNDLLAYLERAQAGQPLHNRLSLLWASSRLPAVLPADARRALIAEVWRKQEPDGGWTLDALGPFEFKEAAKHATGSNAYATAFTAYVMEQVAPAGANPKLAKALAWLRTHQDAEGGYWHADSMNKVYEPGSMQSQFMRDAATSYAILALLGAK
jgi:squalene-hopene/tetraprenyl-beta-curcumene cyclase